ncbi:hypothetical protein [Streptomyces sp. NPDC007905]|uniref:hypothetical protein n=1 Tax=Streptomyces sp. NPDC007905 TaxID=3364788 RepID=UPI0036E7B60A
MKVSKVGVMDAGTAAVLGALAGSVATIGAALATGWAQREGARITARSEHRKERRQPRYGAYKDFITEASRMNDRVGIFAVDYDSFPFERIDSNFTARCEEAADAVKEKWVEVALAGPKEIAETASRLERLSNAIIFRVLGLHQYTSGERSADQRDLLGIRSRIGEEAQEFEHTLDRFIFLAQAALDDDGSLK